MRLLDAGARGVSLQGPFEPSLSEVRQVQRKDHRQGVEHKHRRFQGLTAWPRMHRAQLQSVLHMRRRGSHEHSLQSRPVHVLLGALAEEDV